MRRPELTQALVRVGLALPALIATAVFIAFGALEGGYPPSVWYPAALFVLGLLFVTLVSLPPTRRAPRPLLAASGLLTAYAAWSYLSITWADQRGDAWDGANRTLLYAIVFALFALWPLRTHGATLVLAGLGLGIATLGCVELLRASAAEAPAAYFIDARLSEPVGYPNANVALWCSGLWPCILLASRRELPPLLRGLFLGGAGVLIGLALMGQSRGWLFALPIVSIVFLALVPGRSRVLAALLAVAGCAAWLAGPVLAVHDAFEPGPAMGPLVDAAARAILLGAGALTLAGTVVAYLDRHVSLSAPWARRVGAGFLAATVLAAVGVSASLIADRSRPVDFASELWGELRSASPPQAGSSRFTTSLGTNRADFWRVAWTSFKTHPLTGVGADNFQQDYLQRGTSGEQPRYPHSLELGVLSQTGLVGATLLAAALIAALTVALRAVRRGPDRSRAVAAAATTVFAYWFVQGSIDWFWEFPGLAAPAIAMLGLAGGLAAAPAVDAPQSHPLVHGSRPIAALAIVLCVPAAGLLAPWLSQREIERAARIWSARPELAFTHLDRAARLNPLASEPKLVSASIALRLDRPDLARRDFTAALAREPRNAYARLQLAVVASAQQRRAEAIRMLARATRLSPQDHVIAGALRLARRGKRLDRAEVDGEVLKQARDRVEIAM